MTIDEAIEWLLSDPKRWNDGKMPPSQVTELRRRYKSGALKTNAKLNLIRRSGVPKQGRTVLALYKSGGWLWIVPAQ